MPTCILHAGMPKTGTSSIQVSLRFGLEDPRFRLLTLGQDNAIFFLQALFADEPRKWWVFRRKGYSDARIRRFRDRFDRRLRRSLRRAREAGATPIVSAEDCWMAPKAFLERLKAFMAEEGFETRVIAYVRPFRGLVESLFQQQVKLPASVIDLDWRPERARERPILDYAQRLANLEDTFGRERLVVRQFARKGLAGGCVVRDFCTSLGIELADTAIVRVNESLPADAVRMLYCLNRFATGSPPPIWKSRLLARRLKDLGGETLRFHSAALAPLADHIARQEREVLGRFGIDLREDRPADDASCIREEADFYRFSPASLDWLARSSGRSPIVAPAGEATGRAVAAQVAALSSRPDVRSVWAYASRHLRTRMRWIRHGD